MPQHASLPRIPRQYLIPANLPIPSRLAPETPFCSVLDNLAFSLQPSSYNENAPRAELKRRAEPRSSGRSSLKICHRYVPYYITEFNHTGTGNVQI